MDVDSTLFRTRVGGSRGVVVHTVPFHFWWPKRLQNDDRLLYTSSRKKPLTVSAALYSLYYPLLCVHVHLSSVYSWVQYIYRKVYILAVITQGRGQSRRTKCPEFIFFPEFQVVCLTDGRNIVIPLAIYFLSGHGSHPVGGKEKMDEKDRKKREKRISL